MWWMGMNGLSCRLTNCRVNSSPTPKLRASPGFTVVAMAANWLGATPLLSKASWTTRSMFSLWSCWATVGMMPPVLQVWEHVRLLCLSMTIAASFLQPLTSSDLDLWHLPEMHLLLWMQRLSQYGASLIQHSRSRVITAGLDAQNQPRAGSSVTECVSELQQPQSLHFTAEHLPELVTPVRTGR